jgi:hypothetical protein
MFCTNGSFGANYPSEALDARRPRILELVVCTCASHSPPRGLTDAFRTQPIQKARFVADIRMYEILGAAFQPIHCSRWLYT